VNDSAILHYGYSREEFLSMKITDIRPPEDAPALLKDVARRAKGIEARGAWRHKKKDGTIINVEISSHEIDFSGRKAKVVLAQDVTERKRVEKTVKEAEEKYRTLFDGVPIGLYFSTMDGGFLTVNRELLRMFGFPTQKELVASVERKGFHVRADREEEFLQRIRADRTVSGFESQAFRKDGSSIWISEHARVLHDTEGNLTGFQGAVLNITDRKKADELVLRLLHAVEQTRDVIFMTDPTGRFTYANPAFEQTYGYGIEEVHGKTPAILKSGVQDALLYERFWKTISSGQSIQVEFYNKTKDGKLVIMEATVTPVYDSDAGLTGFIAVQRDITSERTNEKERKSLQEQLFQAQKLESIGTLASGIAHDFNNVLGVILGYAMILRHAVGDDEKALKGIEAINKAVQRGADLVRQILMFARKSDPSFTTIDLSHILTDVEKMVSETFPKTIITTLNVDPRITPIRADKTQMHQALLNLLVNARDAMPDGGSISIIAKRVTVNEVREQIPGVEGTEFIHIGISDTGSGMDEETKQRIFEPFFTTKEVGKGTGLGLAVVYGIIRNHKGYVNVQSAPGEGTTFNLYFPMFVESPQHPVKLEDTTTAVAGGNETIFLVEDERMLMDFLKTSLEAKGYGVLSASDGAEAVSMYRKFHSQIALVISDIGLPKLDGSRVFRELKKINPDVKVLIASGYVDPGLKSGLLKGGARGFLHKPYVLADILKAVRETLDAP